MTKVLIEQAVIDKAVEALQSLQITNPDSEGVMWIHLPGNGTTGEYILRIGREGLIASQCAKLLKKQYEETITALREALDHSSEAAEMVQEPVAWKNLFDAELKNVLCDWEESDCSSLNNLMSMAIDKFKKKNTAPQPVSRAELKDAFQEGFNRAADLYAPQDVSQEPVAEYLGYTAKSGDVFRLDKEIPVGTKLYTAPQPVKREVELTDSEAELAFDRGGNELCLKLRAVIAKHKEKNK